MSENTPPTNARIDPVLGRVLLVAVTFNGRETIGATLASLARQTYPELDFLVVDNGSEDGTPDLVRGLDLGRPVEILELGANLGIAAALNRGVSVAAERGCDWVLLFDQDTEAAEDLLAELAAAVTALGPEKLGVVVPKALNAYRPEVTNPPLRWRDHNLVPVPPEEMEQALVPVDSSLTSGSLLCVDAFRESGGFREDLFIDYVDHEFNLRLLRNGRSNYCATKAVVSHHLGFEREVSTARGPDIYREHAPFRYYYIARNLLFCHLRLFEDGGGVLWVLAKIGAATLRILRHDRRRGAALWHIGRGVVDGLLGRMGPRVRP